MVEYAAGSQQGVCSMVKYASAVGQYGGVCSMVKYAEAGQDKKYAAW